MRYDLERWEQCGRGLHEDSRIIQSAVELSAFDEGFLLGYELGLESSPAPRPTAVKMTLTIGTPKEKP